MAEDGMHEERERPPDAPSTAAESDHGPGIDPHAATVPAGPSPTIIAGENFPGTIAEETLAILGDLPPRIARRWVESIHTGMHGNSSVKHPASRSSSKTAPPGMNVPSQRIAKHGVASKSVAHYEIIELLGKGGMGAVYSARQASVDRMVALKMQHDNARLDPERRVRFLCEAAVTGELEHPNIVPLYDLGISEDGVLFYVMKQVRGTPWKDTIRKASLQDNLEILLRVADAAGYAHSKGIIHRDLKPQNVMLGDFGEVLVMDWGLAAGLCPLPAQAADSAPSSSKADPISESDAVGGTPAYMAPEMARGDLERIGPASDIYLLGAILYEIISGQPPHPGVTAIQCIRKAADNEIEPLEDESELSRIALRAMDSDPSNRYPTVQEFKNAIRDYLKHEESLTLLEQAKDDLARARETRTYDDCANALYGFRAARDLWKDNPDTENGIIATRALYAQVALERGDYDLAASLLTPDEPAHRELMIQVSSAAGMRENRRRRNRSLIIIIIAASALIMAALLGSYLTLLSRYNALLAGAEGRETPDAPAPADHP